MGGFSFNLNLGGFRIGYQPASAEQRDTSTLINPKAWMFGGLSALTESGETVNETTALKLSYVFNCLNVLGKDHGALPYAVRRDVSESDHVTRREIVKTHPVHRLIHVRPNPYMTAFEWHAVTVRQTKARGNSYSLIRRDPVTRVPISIWPTYPWDWNLKLLDGELFYFYKGQAIPYTEIIHFRNFSLDGYCGISTISQNREALGLALKLQKYNARVIGKNPGGYLTAPTVPKDPNQKDNVKKQFNDQVQGDNVGDIPLLYGGLEYKSVSLTPEDAQYIDSAKLNKKQIYGMFDVPMARGHDNEGLTYSNAEQQLLIYVKHCIMPDVVMREQELNVKLFPESNIETDAPLYIKANLAGLLRGDTASQKDFFQTMLTLGVFSPNDVLELLDMSGYDGGERRFMQGAMVPVDIIDQFVLKNATPATRDMMMDALTEFLGSKKPGITADQQRQLREKLNGSYADVANILGLS